MQVSGFQRCRVFENDEHAGLGGEVDTGTGLDWRDTFMKAYKGMLFWTSGMFQICDLFGFLLQV
ncbi:hypothetical protein U1Q18_041155 [Sarracenia purpurea var. burkii]